MHPEFRNLVSQALSLQDQLNDLRHRMRTGEPTDSGQIASHDLQERLDALYARIGHEVPEDLIDSGGGRRTYRFTGRQVEVDPRERSGERFVNWLRDHPEDMDAFVQAMGVP